MVNPPVLGRHRHHCPHDHKTHDDADVDHRCCQSCIQAKLDTEGDAGHTDGQDKDDRQDLPNEGCVTEEGYRGDGDQAPENVPQSKDAEDDRDVFSL